MDILALLGVSWNFFLKKMTPQKKSPEKPHFDSHSAEVLLICRQQSFLKRGISWRIFFRRKSLDFRRREVWESFFCLMVIWQQIVWNKNMCHDPAKEILLDLVGECRWKALCFFLVCQIFGGKWPLPKRAPGDAILFWAPGDCFSLDLFSEGDFL